MRGILDVLAFGGGTVAVVAIVIVLAIHKVYGRQRVPHAVDLLGVIVFQIGLGALGLAILLSFGRWILH